MRCCDFEGCFEGVETVSEEKRLRLTVLVILARVELALCLTDLLVAVLGVSMTVV